jgi:hypothetical protein
MYQKFFKLIKSLELFIQSQFLSLSKKLTKKAQFYKLLLKLLAFDLDILFTQINL